MVLKFKKGKYFKNRFDCCDFIKVVECISDTGEEAEVVAIWYTRIHGWTNVKEVSNETRFRITKRQYPFWRQVNLDLG